MWPDAPSSEEMRPDAPSSEEMWPDAPSSEEMWPDAPSSEEQDIPIDAIDCFTAQRLHAGFRLKRPS
ncbi:MAG: hypothetical protein R3C09_13225 [Pirellulaceae bacterium]